MSALHELQQAFASAVFAEENGLLAYCAGDPARAGRAIQAYRQSVLSNLAGALQLTYPLVGRIVGESFMLAVSRRYAQLYPSQSGDLNRYGEAFADFLAGLDAVAGLPYLSDVARLEWQVLQVSGAADAAPQDLSLLTQTPPEDWGELCFELTPAHALLQSGWPLHDIWRVNQPDHAGEMAIDFSNAQSVLVVREATGLTVSSLSAQAAVVLAALAAGQTLQQALDSVPDDADFDLQALLAMLIGHGLLIRARVKEPS